MADFIDTLIQLVYFFILYYKSWLALWEIIYYKMKFIFKGLMLCLMLCCSYLYAQTKKQEFPLDTITHLASARKFPFTGKIDITQNYPNPFSILSFTSIRFKAIDVYSAQFVLYSSTGEIIQLLKLKPGVGEVVLKGGQLEPGVYLYALIVNGRRTSVKRMLVVASSIEEAQ